MQKSNEPEKKTASPTGAELTIFETSTGRVELSPDRIRKYLVNGNTAVTDKEVMEFLCLCKYQKLNPFLKEAYLIKYGQDANIVTSKDVFLKRAQKSEQYDGYEYGLTWDEGDGGEKSAWCKVYRKDRKYPAHVVVHFDEYVGLKDEWVDGKKTGDKVPNRQWETKPKTMIRKVAIAQGHREAFPEDLAQLYTQEELDHLIGEPDKKQPKSGKPETTAPESTDAVDADFQEENDSQEPVHTDAPIDGQDEPA